MNDNMLDELPELLPEKREPTKLVGVDERGNRVGEDHPRAKLTDHEVDLIRELWETRAEWGGSVRKIAEKFEVGKSQIHEIVTFRSRTDYPTGFRRVRVLVAGRERFGTCSLVDRENVADLI